MVIFAKVEAFNRKIEVAEVFAWPRFLQALEVGGGETITEKTHLPCFDQKKTHEVYFCGGSN